MLDGWDAENLNSAWAVSNGIQATSSATGTGTGTGTTGTGTGTTGTQTGSTSSTSGTTAESGTTGMPLAVEITLILERTDRDGNPKQVAFTRWVHLPCGTLVPPDDSSTTTGSTTGTTGSTGTGGGQ